LCVLQTLNTEIALRGGFPIIIKLHGPEGASLHTLFTADTQIIIDKD
jgi:hypothetical protein